MATEQNSTHTPGERAKAPWYVSGTRTRHNAMPVLQIISEPSGEVLALVPYSDRTPTAHADCYADARLIAASPELIDAIKSMIAWGVEPDPDSESVREGELSVAWSKARAAIAKAEGRQS